MAAKTTKLLRIKCELIPPHSSSLMRKFLNSWFVEIILVVSVVSAFYLYGAYADIISESFVFVPGLAEAIIVNWLAFLDFFNDLVRGVYLKSLLIGVLGLTVVWLIFRRIRWRMRRSDVLTSMHCPKCSYPLVRIKRTTTQHYISMILPLRRLFCKKCKWSGVRIKSYDFADTPSVGNRMQQRTESIKGNS